MKTAVIRARVTAEELEEIRKRAAAAGQPVSIYVREKAMGRLVSPRKPLLGEEDLEEILGCGRMLKKVYVGEIADPAETLRKVAAAFRRMHDHQADRG